MVVLFLGAGASAAFGYPAMADLNKQLSNMIVRAPYSTSKEKARGELYYNLSSGLQRTGVDAETILQDLQTIDSVDKQKLGDMFTGITMRRTDGLYVTDFSELLSISQSLHTRIEECIFEIYRFKRESEKFLPLYDSLFRLLWSRTARSTIEVYTTNYDRIIEQFCVRHEDVELRDGFIHDSKSMRYIWDPSQSFDSEPRDPEKSPHLVNLYKLHGSLHWKRSGDIIERASHEVFSIPEASDIVIYPGGKELPPEGEPFETLYDRFENEMKKKEEPCVVIGFSFRDPYLNRIFRRFIDGGVLFVMSRNPAETLSKNLLRLSYAEDFAPFIEKGNIVPIQCRLGQGEWLSMLMNELRARPRFNDLEKPPNVAVKT